MSKYLLLSLTILLCSCNIGTINKLKKECQTAALVISKFQIHHQSYCIDTLYHTKEWQDYFKYNPIYFEQYEDYNY